MNVLAIDAGNTRIKWGWACDDQWVQLSSLRRSAAAELASAYAVLPRPDKIVISNVAGEEVRERIAAALAPFRVEPRWIRSEAQRCGVRSAYNDPAQLGSDRWAALIGAWHLFGGPCVVANAGTTLTVDALSGEGLFLGGFIVPGVDLMRDVLARNTAQLTDAAGRFNYFPDRTADAITSGAINALVGSIERMMRYMAETGHTALLVALSGGAAPLLAPHLSARSEVVDNLVLEGLLRIAQSD